ncbi:MAG: response regulator [Rhodospirillales bacterium]|nr:response regulator [Rhodospirillales bacterium]
MRILLADDEPKILEEYIHVLGKAACSSDRTELDDLEAELFGTPAAVADQHDFELYACHQGSEAVAAIDHALQKGRPFAVAFLDIRMPPGEDGIAAAERIRELDPFINIVFVTGFSDVRPEDIGRRVLPADKLMYCQKPLQPTELKQLAHALTTKWAAEWSLRTAKERLHQLMTSTSVVVYSCGYVHPYTCTYVSENIETGFGHAPRSFLDDAGFLDKTGTQRRQGSGTPGPLVH